MPHCDLATGEIYGCQEGSRSWFHEKGHLEFNRIESKSKLILLRQYASSLWMLFATFSIISKLFLIFAIPLVLFYIGSELYEEAWCNWFAEMEIKRHQIDLNKEKPLSKGGRNKKWD